MGKKKSVEKCRKVSKKCEKTSKKCQKVSKSIEKCRKVSKNCEKLALFEHKNWPLRHKEKKTEDRRQKPGARIQKKIIAAKRHEGRR